MPITTQAQRNVNQLFRGGSRPVLAVIAFFATFLFAALPFAFDTDNVLVVAPCIIASFSCAILFMRFLIGEPGMVKWILLAAAGYLCISAGREWYVVLLLTGGTICCSILFDRLIGKFVPLINVSEHRRA